MLGNHAADTLLPLFPLTPPNTTTSIPLQRYNRKSRQAYCMTLWYNMGSYRLARLFPRRTELPGGERKGISSMRGHRKGVLFSVLLPFTLTLVQGCSKRLQALCNDHVLQQTMDKTRREHVLPPSLTLLLSSNFSHNSLLPSRNLQVAL